MLITDDTSDYQIAEILTIFSVRTVIPRLENVFSIWGNGRPLNGHEFKEFASYIGFHYREATPCTPLGTVL